MMQLHLLTRTGEVVYNKVMESRLMPAYQLLEKTSRREDTRARRKQLLKTLYHERYLTWKGLAWRLEWVLGWTPSRFVFIQDMWFVRKAFQAAGYQVAYSWTGEMRGFYLRGEGELSQEWLRAIQGAVTEVDPRQVEITRRLTPAQRVQQGLSLTNLAHSVVRYRKEMIRGKSDERI
jgi:hypothetical protein